MKYICEFYVEEMLSYIFAIPIMIRGKGRKAKSRVERIIDVLKEKYQANISLN